MRKPFVIAGLILAAGMPAMAQPATTPPELVNRASAREGIRAERLAFEYFKASPESLVTVARITIAPGQFIPMHFHSGPGFHYVLVGELEETVGDEPPRKLKAGEGRYAAGDVPHGLKNASNEPATFIAFITGTKGSPLTTPFKK